MPNIINPFHGADPLAQTIADLGRTMFGDQAGGAIKREQLRALQRGNVETEALMGQVAKQGVQNMGADPLAQAMIIGSGYKPDDYASLGRMGAALAPGATSTSLDPWRSAAGAPASALQGNFDATLGETTRNDNMQSADRRYNVDQGNAESRYQYDNKLLPTLQGPTLTPTLTPQVNAAGAQPVLTDTERKGTMAGQYAATPGGLGGAPIAEQTYMGADQASAAGRTPKNYRDPQGNVHITYDGIHDAQSGGPLPPGGFIASAQGTAADVGLTNSVQSAEESNRLAYQRFGGLLDIADGLTKDPTLFGPVGRLRTAGQEIGQTFHAASQVFGTQNADQAISLAQQTLQQSGVNPQLLPELFNYDPKLPQVDTIWGLMVYQGAAALAGQQNRSVSDKDVATMRTILGNPKSFFSSNLDAQAHIAAARQVLALFSGVTDNALDGSTTAGAKPPGAPALVPPTVGQPNVVPTSQAPPVEQWARDPATGQLHRVQ